MRKTLLTLYFFLQIICHLLASSDDQTISAQQYITIWKDEAIAQMVAHKIPASITLAQGMLESGNGNSRLAKEGNNHFGIKCHNDWSGKKIYEDDETSQECFRKYDSANQSFEDHSLFLKKKRYESLFQLELDDYKGWAKGLKDCGYATNPKYPSLLIKLIEENNLQQYDEIGLLHIKNNTSPKNGDVAENNAPKLNNENSTTINLNANRDIQLSKNRIKYTIVKKGETFNSIARDLDMNVNLLAKYNDMSLTDTLKEGQLLYIQPKRGRGSDETYTVKKGDTVWSISQAQGIKIKKLLKRNGLQTSDAIEVGMILKLK